jgi:TonB-dependent starch-binding outer membrane protein SusC
MKKTVTDYLHAFPRQYSHIEKLMVCLLAGLLLQLSGAAQTGNKVSGKVTNAQGTALPGVTVQVKNSSVSTATDAAGSFTITAGPTDTLELSSIGFKTLQLPVAGKTVLQVTLQEDAQSLNNVVVVGYTTQRKKDLTGSVSVVNTGDIAGLPVGGVDQILQGKAAGVTVTQNTGAPGDGVVVRIRGIGTINNNDPLYIIDGVPTKDGINQISPNDIETISVLKDASAASIYGARASNGVVVVTTKKGKTGKPRFSFNAYTGVQQPVNLIKMADTRQYVTAYNTAADADGRQQIPLGMLDTLPNVDWQKEVLNNANMSNVQLSLSGGSDNTKYLVSGSYFTQEGMIMNSSNDRFNLRTSIDSRINSIFRVGVNLNLAYNKTRQVGSSGDGFGSGNPGASVMRYALFRTSGTPVYDKSGNLVDIPDPSAFFGDGLNPVGLAQNTDRNFRTTSVLGDVYLEITPIEHLKIKTDFGTNYIITDYKQFFPTWGSPQRLQNSPNALAQSNTNNYNYNWTNTATYDWKLDKHQFNFLAGTEIIFNRSRLISASNTNFPNQTPNFIYLSNGTGITPSVGGNESSASLSSLFGRIDYQYDGRYLAAFNFRRDGSSRLDPSNRWGNFYSGSVGWRISSEKFMENIDWLSNLKLRASVGQLGNQEINYYNYTSLIGSYGYYPFGSTAASAYTIYAKGNPNVKWETSTTTDVGLDIGLLKGDLNISIDYYRKITSDLLVNNGKVLNRGFDFEVNYKKELDKDWHIGVNGNLSIIHNEVLELLNNQQLAYGRVDNNVFATAVAVGQPIGAFYLLQQEGIFQNALDVFTHAYQGANIQPGDVKFKDINKDGKIDQNDRVFSGSAIPKFTYGFTGTVAYKDFDLSIFFQGAQGNKIYNQINTDIEGFYRAFNITERTATESWNGEGTSNTQPRLSWIGAQNNKITSTRFLEDGSYLRLKNVQLGYNLPSKLISRMKVSGARLYVSGQNLLTFTRYTGLDPEIATSANAAGEGAKAAGIDWGTYPSARILTVGVNVNF